MLRTMSSAHRPRPATIEDFLAHPEQERLELIRGTLIPKAMPGPEHAGAQFGTSLTLGDAFYRGPGGWRFFTELTVRFAGEVHQPDICAHRRERMPAVPRERPISLVPDWVCEILSPSNASTDRVEKHQTYFRCGVPHYWIIDPIDQTLEVFRRTDIGYAPILAARAGEHVRAEPFDATEIAVNDHLAIDPETGAES